MSGSVSSEISGSVCTEIFNLKLIGLIHKKETLRVKTGIDEALHAKKLIIGNHKQLETNGNKLYLTKTDRLILRLPAVGTTQHGSIG